MKVLVIGNGGREHALVWGLLRSANVQQIYCVPGNGGTATLERCHTLKLSSDDFEGIARFCTVNNIGLVVVGPEVPLALGITDYLQQHSIKVFGPSKAGAQIEASKAWAKELMNAAGIPTAESAVFTDVNAAKDYVRKQGAPIVVKADGLAAGKGVTVASTVAAAEAALDACFAGQFGDAGQSVVIEECLVGQEASILAVTDGITIRPLLPAQDHKRIGEGDTGENTGGMGVYAPAPVVTSEIMARVQQEVLEPAIAILKQRQIPYCGILYAGLMISPEGVPKVIEFNCRFGDPETQAVLPLLETPLDTLMLACTDGTLAAHPPIEWKTGAAACVVLAAPGYPGKYPKGMEISGIEAAEATGAIVFHAGTSAKDGKTLSNGGRILGVTALGDNFDQAFARTYEAVNAIQFEGKYFRRDIGHRVRSST
ncbi:phosphoribosylamine--glycine ligase [filamentous cyanobacterium LEGE 11480]|uniref:Phosphoribosylamine--glycine ligase n=1 Tax=Romeriopsis navalis LEGE 11480 TaxID=2777977 RepID=A0A928VKR6_9CYAN|nr:phosphoribosylamine--glycine ligase [Romeriopsis navalis LEGE 11480]